MPVLTVNRIRSTLEYRVRSIISLLVSLERVPTDTVDASPLP